MSISTRIGIAGAAGLFALASALPASAHSIAGNRVFPATLAIDDPGVSDELALPTITYLPGEGSEADYSFEYDKRITPNFAVSISDTYIDAGHRSSGFDNLGVGLKYLAYVNAEHEFMASLGLDMDIGKTGAAAVNAERFWTLTPEIDVGKGFGDLPTSMNFLRPFAVTGEVGYAVPTQSRSGDDLNPQSLEGGFTVQYSLPYLNANVHQVDGPEFIKHLIPIVEASFETPVAHTSFGERETTGTIQPGVIYMGDTYQVALEAVIPVNRASGHHIGIEAELHFFLDDIFPHSIGKPIFQ